MSKTLATQIQPLKLPPDTHFLGLYASAVISALQPDFVPPTLQIGICPSSLKRHAPKHTVDPTWLMSLPTILETLAWKQLHVYWQTPDLIARVEALELCLAALALEWQVQLSVADAVVPMLSSNQTGVKGFLSLPLFGLEHIGVSEHAAQSLHHSSLVLPWHVERLSSTNRVVI